MIKINARFTAFEGGDLPDDKAQAYHDDGARYSEWFREGAWERAEAAATVEEANAILWENYSGCDADWTCVEWECEQVMPKYYRVERDAQREKNSGGHPVLTIPGSPVIAVAHSKSENAKVWDILDMDENAFLCQARGAREAHRILIDNAKARDIKPTETYQPQEQAT